MRAFSVVVISILLLTSGISGCIFSHFSTKPESRPIFVQKVGGQSLVLPVHGSQLKIEESGSVKVYCPGGFRKEGLHENREHISENTTVKLSCIAGRTVRWHDDRTYHFEQGESLNCTRPPFSVYENRQMHRFCEGTSYVVGMLYDREPITLAEICYDVNRMRVKYQSYKSVERSPVIARKGEYEPLFLFYPFDEELVDAPSEQFYQHFLLTQNHTHNRFIHKSTEYIYEDLIPGDAFEPYYSNAMNSAKALSKIFWWKGLKGGNWRLFEKILKRRSIKVTYDIILGIMGTSPDCDIRQGPLSEISLSCSATPKLIWAFLSDENYEEEFVVIGVNTPYFELLSPVDTIICHDICDSISWLEPLNKFRNISALGYIYCCRPEEVRNRLEGVSDIFFKKHYRYEIEYAKTAPPHAAGETYGNDNNSHENPSVETSNPDPDWENTVDSKFSGENDSTEKSETKKPSFVFWP